MPQTIDTIICCQSYAQIKWHFLRQEASLVCNSEFSLDNLWKALLWEAAEHIIIFTSTLWKI